ncbi:uncharacterized protein [Periplaneta americana]|uniref:uncharacterized protein isoform X8 n=1 Tax=Periplaneta americana TaxID=6978 RepID=UPI0037E95669
MDVIKMELEGDPLAIETHYITEEEKKPILKMELEVDPLAIETSDITDVEEKEPILKDVTIKTPIKTECKDYDLPSKVKYEAQGRTRRSSPRLKEIEKRSQGPTTVGS